MAEPKSEIKEISASKRELELEIPAEEALKEYENALEQYAERAKVKGFRQGKAPREVVKAMYETEIREAMFDSIAPRAVGRELAAHQASPVSTPVVTDLSWEEGTALKLKAEFEVWPEFELPEYKKIRVQQKQDPVTTEDVAASLEDLRERSAQYLPVEGRGVKQDDYVMLRIQGKDVKTGRLLPAEKIFVLAGHPDNETALNSSILGMHVNEEKHFQVDYPQDHKNRKVAGKTVDYHTTVLSIKEKNLPKVDDGFAKDLGTENIDVSIVCFPCIRGQAGLETGLLQKSQTIPVVFQGNLWQEHPPVKTLFDVNTMFADFDFLDLFNFLQRRED